MTIKPIKCSKGTTVGLLYTALQLSMHMTFDILVKSLTLDVPQVHAWWQTLLHMPASCRSSMQKDYLKLVMIVAKAPDEVSFECYIGLHRSSSLK